MALWKMSCPELQKVFDPSTPVKPMKGESAVQLSGGNTRPSAKALCVARAMARSKARRRKARMKSPTINITTPDYEVPTLMKI
jgi:hypothetical protein